MLIGYTYRNTMHAAYDSRGGGNHTSLCGKRLTFVDVERGCLPDGKRCRTKVCAEAFERHERELAK